MSRVIDYVIEGNLTNGKKIDFAKDKLAVHAFVRDKELAHASVDDKGHYKLQFAYEEKPPATQIRVAPAAFGSATETMALSDTVPPGQYVVKGNTAVAEHNVNFPSEYLEIMRPLFAAYQFHGEVYAATYDQATQELEYVGALGGLKIDFFLEVPLKPPVLVHKPWPPSPHPLPKMPFRMHLGTAFSSPNPVGSYVFDFKLPFPEKPFLPLGVKPEVKAVLSQLLYGAWTKVFEDTVDWQMQAELRKDFFVPAGNLRPIPVPGPHPTTTGFLFEDVGLLPIDATRIVDGYANTQPGDLGGVVIKNEPFCSTLWIYGLFAKTPSPAAYKVQVAYSRDNVSWGAWEDVTDPLNNSIWNAATHTWDSKYLGPNPSDLNLAVMPPNVYRNIDNDTLIWNTPALKFHWNSATPKGDGCYMLRVIPYDANGKQITRKDPQGHVLDANGYAMPMIRVCNTRPIVNLLATNPLPTQCGILQSTQTITFLVAATDNEGMGYFDVTGTRGRDGLPAGAEIYNPPETAPALPSKNLDFNIDFAIAPLNTLATCPAVAYDFLLTVQGLGTDGFSNNLEERRNWTHSDLIILK